MLKKTPNASFLCIEAGLRFYALILPQLYLSSGFYCLWFFRRPFHPWAHVRICGIKICLCRSHQRIILFLSKYLLFFQDILLLLQGLVHNILPFFRVILRRIKALRIAVGQQWKASAIWLKKASGLAWIYALSFSGSIF